MNDLKKVALVTGGSRGIGAAISKRLAEDGFHVVINYSSNEQRAKQTLDSIAQNGGSGSLSGFDVSNSKQIDEAVDEIAKRWGPIHTLINNAGITIDSLLMRLKDEDLDKTLAVDLKGAIYCTRSCIRSMMKAKRGGSIIQVSSVVGEMGNAGQAAYSAAKAGLIGFTKSMARELASRQIRVNCITPGYIATEMTEVLTDTQKEAILRNIPIGTMGQPQDIAHTVAFLSSDRGAYITGQVIGVNGGMYM